MKCSPFKSTRKPLRKKSRSKKHAAWAVFSEYIRRRDSDETGFTKCISCETVKPWREMDCGHYVPKSVSLALRFHEINNNSQCRSCNCFRHGNLTQYALGLKKKHGDDVLERLDELRRTNQGFRITETEYTDLFELYTKKLEEMGHGGS